MYSCAVRWEACTQGPESTKGSEPSLWRTESEEAAGTQGAVFQLNKEEKEGGAFGADAVA